MIVMQASNILVLNFFFSIPSIIDTGKTPQSFKNVKKGFEASKKFDMTKGLRPAKRHI